MAYFFTDQIEAIVADVHRVERWLALAGLLTLAARWSAACGEGNDISGRNDLRGNKARGMRRDRESRTKKLGPRHPR